MVSPYSGMRIIVLIGLVVAFICGLTWWSISHRRQERMRMDSDAYHFAINMPYYARADDHIAALRSYLKEFPNGSFVQEASEALRHWNDVASGDYGLRCGDTFRQKFWDNCVRTLGDDNIDILCRLGKKPQSSHFHKTVSDLMRLSKQADVFLGFELQLQISSPNKAKTQKPVEKQGFGEALLKIADTYLESGMERLNSTFEFRKEILRLSQGFAEQHGRILIETEQINPRLVITLTGEKIGKEYLRRGDTQFVRELRRVSLSIAVQDSNAVIWKGDPVEYTDKAVGQYLPSFGSPIVVNQSVPRFFNDIGISKTQFEAVVPQLVTGLRGKIDGLLTRDFFHDSDFSRELYLSSACSFLLYQDGLGVSELLRCRNETEGRYADMADSFLRSCERPEEKSAESHDRYE